MAVQLDAAQARAGQAEAARAAAEADRDAAVEAARRDAATRIAAAEAERDAAIAQVRAEAARACQRRRALTGTRPAAWPRRQNRLPGSRSRKPPARRPPPKPPGPRSGRVRADAEKMLAGFRADAARDRDELRADLRARAERAEHQADAYRDELDQLRAGTNHDTDITTRPGRHGAPGKPPSRNSPRARSELRAAYPDQKQAQFTGTDRRRKNPN